MSWAVDILMPTYNAAPWIGDFMRSLLAQEFTDWRLIVRDDASKDDTLAQLADWKARLGAQMMLLSDDLGNIGVMKGMTELIKSSNAARIMLADPDDVWCASKMTILMDEMIRIEAKLGNDIPIAIATDAIVVDANLKEIHSSYWKSRWLNPNRPYSLKQFAIEGPTLSSTMIVNRPVALRALPVPEAAQYQDWWLSIIACAFGQLKLLPAATVLYRRHGNNLTEVTVESRNLLQAIWKLLVSTNATRSRVRAEVERVARQASSFVERFGEHLDTPDLRAIRAIATLPSRSPVGKRWMLVRHGLWYSTMARNVRMLALI